MEKYKPINRRRMERVLPHIWDVTDLCDIIERHGNKTLFRYYEGKDIQSMTYATFGTQVREAAAAFTAMGLCGEKIAVIGETSPQWVCTYLGALAAGCVIVPMDKELDTEEIRRFIAMVDARAIVYSKSFNEKFIKSISDGDTGIRYFIPITPAYDSSFDNKVIAFDQLLTCGRERVERDGYHYPIVRNREKLAEMLFTSGTTGLAKGVMLSHRNLAQNVYNMSKFFRIPDGGRVLSVLPIHHAYEMSCTVMTSFYQGATVVICEGLKHIQSNFAEAECSVMLGVPLIFENMHRKVWKQAEKRGSLSKLQRGIALSKKMKFQNHPRATRKMFQTIHKLFGKNHYMFIAGGAAIDPAVIDDFEAMGFPMFQGYGMTECSPIIAMNSDRYRKSAAAGKPLPGTEVRIVDENEEGIGEIIAKGPSVMQGYYKDPENTAKTLRDGWLYTGDYGYFDEDGFLFITGRKKNVIVTKGGKNIFPEEVEYYLQLDERIQEVIVYGKHDDTKDDLVCTAIIYPNYSVLREQGVQEDGEIYRVLRKIVDDANDKMPPYKRVKRIEVRDEEFIKTTTLKIKRFEEQNYEYKFDDRSIHSGRRV